MPSENVAYTTARDTANGSAYGTARVLYGKPVAQRVYEGVDTETERLAHEGVTPCLAIVSSVGDDASATYERSLMRTSAKHGITTRQIRLAPECTQSEALGTIASVNADSDITGCLILRPLSPSLDEDALCDSLVADKDVDGVSAAALGSVFSGRGFGLAPCTAEACVRMLDFYGIDVAGKRVAVLGRSLTVGRPLSMMLLARDATVTLCHSKTQNAEDICKESDVVICATGRAKAFGKGFFAPGQTILDVGIDFDETGALCGDVDADEIGGVVQAYSPVPGGIGTVTTSVMMDHVVRLARARWEKRHA